MFLFVFAGTPQSALAAVTDVTGSPATVAVDIGGGSVTIRWRVVNSTAGNAQSSANARLLIGGSAVATLAGTLGGVAGAANSPAFYTETLQISPAQAQRIARSGGAATIQRAFVGSGAGAGGPVTGSVRVIVSGGAAELSVSRIELQFRSGGETAVVPRRGALQVVADIRYSGNGMLEAAWEVSAVDALRGSGVFRTIQRVRQPLTSGGPGRLRLDSPDLPTGLSGLFEVRLTVTDPALGFNAPALRYFVATENAGGGNEIGLLGPAPGAPLSPDTLFVWRPVPGAVAYQLEILPVLGPQEERALAEAWRTGLLLDDGAAPVAGRLVRDGVVETRLSALNLEGLPVLDAYDWRVRAYDGEGRLIAPSQRRRLGG